MKQTYSIILLILVLMIFACKPTIKGETSKFNNNQQSIQRLKNTFPGFKTFLEDLSRKAEDIFNESDTIIEEEQKIEKMREANRIIYNDRLYSQLNVYNDLLRRINSKKNELASILDPEYQLAIQAVIDNINFQVKEAEDYLRFSRPQNYNEAVIDCDKATSVLTQAESILDKTINAINEEKNKSTPVTGADMPMSDEQEDLGGRESPNSVGDDGSRGGSVTEEEDLGGRD